MIPRVGDELRFPDDSIWVVAHVEDARDAIESKPQRDRAGEESRIAAAMGADWRDRYWKAVVTRKGMGSGSKQVDSVQAAMEGIELVSLHIEL